MRWTWVCPSTVSLFQIAPMSYEEFKQKYASEIEDYDLTEDAIQEAYQIYLEDPAEFHSGMIG